MIRLSDFMGNAFGEDDYVIFADGRMSLRKAKVRAIKEIISGQGNRGGYMVALEIVEGQGVYKKRYSRRYHIDDFMKVEE